MGGSAEAVTPHPIMVALRRERERQRLTAQSIADRTGYHVQTIRKSETGENSPSLVLAEDYATAIGWELVLAGRRDGRFVRVPERVAAEDGLCGGCGRSYQVRRNGAMRKHTCKTKEDR